MDVGLLSKCEVGPSLTCGVIAGKGSIAFQSHGDRYIAARQGT
jgi:hypothetical protein